jgi:hypothetical protein
MLNIRKTQGLRIIASLILPLLLTACGEDSSPTQTSRTAATMPGTSGSANPGSSTGSGTQSSGGGGTQSSNNAPANNDPANSDPPSAPPGAPQSDASGDASDDTSGDAPGEDPPSAADHAGISRPFAVPGEFEAENFDLGGPHLGYLDKTAGNAGGMYRPDEDVDIIADSEASGGYVITDFETGEWLSYTIEVSDTGEYDFALHVSTPQSGAAFSLAIDGAVGTGSVAVPSTGGWSRFSWVVAPRIFLTAGQHRLRVLSEQEYFRLDSIRATLAPAAADPSTVEFSCSFANSPTDCGFREQAKVAGRATIVNVARDGNTAVRLNTQPGDTNVSGSGSAVRNDLMLSQTATGCYEGVEQWWAHSVLFPDDYVVPPDWGVAFDFHHTGSTGQANFHVDAASYGLRLRGYGGPSVDGGRYEVMLGPVVRNKWYDFVYNVRWSSGTDGFLDAWVDGRHVLSHRGPTLYAGMGCYLKLANYHTATDQASSIIHDRVIRGTTPEAVSIGPLEGVLEVVNGQFRLVR